MLILPENLREEVRKPFGKVLTGKKLALEIGKAAHPLISVGDQCSADLIKNGTPPDMLVFDFKIKREEITKEMKQLLAPFAKNAFVVLSAPGVISDALEEAVGKMLSESKGAVFVAGEDDLSALLIMAHAKKGTLVYGQPDKGAVVVELGKKQTLERAKEALDRMDKQ